MSSLTDDKNRKDILNRLKRAEGQIRGVQRMVEAHENCIDIASQMAAVRKALDSAYARMTVCFIEQELLSRLEDTPQCRQQVGEVLASVRGLLDKVR
jgi:DNA-binding FrmR family transcriptional regulator